MSVIALLALLTSARRACPRFPPFLTLLLPLLALLLTAPPRPLCAAAERAKRVESGNATRLVVLRNKTHGAKCLDGSPPAYYFRAGRGAGRRKWHVHLLLGSRLPRTHPSCPLIPTVPLSPHQASEEYPQLSQHTAANHSLLPLPPPNPSLLHQASEEYPHFGGLLSRRKRANPVFHGWNLVWVVYCDGGAYSSTRGRADLGEGASVPAHEEGHGGGVSSALLGQLCSPMLLCYSRHEFGFLCPCHHHALPPLPTLFLPLMTASHSSPPSYHTVVFADLRRRRGMGAASHVLFSGSSAGGHAIIMHCDRLAAAFPRAQATCLADSGFFVDAKDRFGQNFWRGRVQALTALHRINVPNCPAGAQVKDNWVCFFPENTLPQITTPLFLFQFHFDPRVIFHENQLPRNRTQIQYETNCLTMQILLPNASAVAREHAWGGLDWNPSFCLPQEVDAVFSMASLLYGYLAEAARGKRNLGVVLAPGMGHTVVFYSSCPPAYYFRAGAGAGRRKWHVHLPTGGWCFSPRECLERANSPLGSSRFWATRLPAVIENGGRINNASEEYPQLGGLLSQDSAANPVFHAWNLVWVVYCDGGAYSSTRGRADLGEGASVYMQGRQILDDIITDLRRRWGMGAASHVLFSGSSAGGHAIIMHCDRLAAAFPRAKAKCLADSGFFVDAKDRFGVYSWREYIRQLTALHRIEVPKCPSVFSFDVETSQNLPTSL
ncbi:unnamed protein product [Closterium sp. Naga37s-1]|nr:unnamed protein product [Closterium sp. Naga37s-1]